MTGSGRAVFFDAGNTLLLFDHAYLGKLARLHGRHIGIGRLQEAESRVRYSFDCELLDRLESGEQLDDGSVSMAANFIWQRYFGRLLRALDLPECACEVMTRDLLQRERTTERGLWCLVDPSTIPMLIRLRDLGFSVGVVSNSDGRLRTRLRLLGMERHLDFILDSADVGIEKPDPRLFESALRISGVSGASAWHVGDLYSVDVLGARAAGIHAVLYDPADQYVSFDATRIRDWSELFLHLEEATSCRLESRTPSLG